MLAKLHQIPPSSRPKLLSETHLFIVAFLELCCMAELPVLVAAVRVLTKGKGQTLQGVRFVFDLCCTGATLG